MHLTLHTSYALRVLVYLAQKPDRVVSTLEVSEAYAISKNHLVRVVQGLGQHGFIEVRQGRAGGILLARPAAEIRVGAVVRCMEPDFTVLECFDLATNTCPIAPACALTGVVQEALKAFFIVLDGCTLEDLRRRSGSNLASLFLRPRE